MSVSDGADFDFGDWDSTRASFSNAAERSPFVQRQLERSGLTALEVIADPDAWRGLVPIGKRELIADQEHEPPFGSRRCVPTSEIALTLESSGSTGQGREVHYLSRGDVERSARAWSQYLATIGIGADDVVALTFPIGMAGGGVRHWYAYVELGAMVLRLGGLDSERRLEAIRLYGATTLVATPAYVDRLGMVCREHGASPGDLPIRRIMVATQSLSVDWVRATEELWGARLYEWYGTSAGIAAFCCERGVVGPDGERGTLHWNPSISTHEILDPDSGAAVGDGERGELVGTPLINEAEPLFRVETGDEVRFRAPGACPCGSPRPGIESGTVRRLDAMFKVKGINVWPARVEAIVMELPEVLDYRVRIFQDERKRERLRLELLAQRPPESLVDEVSATLRAAVGVGFEVRAISDRTAWSQETVGEAAKAKRWLDERTGA